MSAQNLQEERRELAALPDQMAPISENQPYLLQHLPLRNPATLRCNGNKLCGRLMRMLTDSQTQTVASELPEQHCAMDEAARLGPKLQHQIRDAVAMRRSVAAALQQAQERAQAQVHENTTDQCWASIEGDRKTNAMPALCPLSVVTRFLVCRSPSCEVRRLQLCG